MKLKWIIAETWNGEGYSSENTASIQKIDGPIADFLSQKALAIVTSQMPCGRNIEVKAITDTQIGYTIGDDHGTVQAFAYNENIYGVVIFCNTNEVKLVDEDEFNLLMKRAIDQADPDEEYNTNEDLFVGAFGDDVDYQFIRLVKPEPKLATVFLNRGSRLNGKRHPKLNDYIDVRVLQHLEDTCPDGCKECAKIELFDSTMAWMLDLGEQCNRLLNFAEELNGALNVDRHQVRDDIRDIVRRVAEFENLQTE